MASCTITLITISTLFILSLPSFSLSAAAPFKKIYAFGDSFTDTGNTKSISGPSGFGHVSNSPYGTTFFHRPTNRYSDGRLVIDFVAEALSLPFLPPYMKIKGNASSHGVNFAVAGSTLINHEFFVKNNLSLDITPQSIQTQLGWFSRYMESHGGDSLDDALFWVGEIGVNDYAYILGSDVSSDTIRKLGLYSFTNFLEALLKRGAKYMVVQGFPTTGCLTLAMTLAGEDDRDNLGCVKSSNNQSYIHNLNLKDELNRLRNQYPNTVIVYADYYNAYRTVVENPGKYGFKERFSACCGTEEPPYNFSVFATCGTPNATACKKPWEYINWDGVHLTEAMYKVMTDMFIRGGFSQPPFSSLMEKKLH